jgi:sulfhydrogenase subunit alpha
MKITVPHIHKIEGEAGFWARVTKTGKIEELKFQTLLGLRQIEGILVGRRYFEVPIVVSRICGICPVPHILGACTALENALNVKVSEQTVLLRKLLLAANIIYSHTLHLFFPFLALFYK